jgi:hypothetical protein
MKLIKAILNAINFLRTTSQLEYYIRTKQPQTHSEVDRLVRDFYSIRGL